MPLEYVTVVFKDDFENTMYMYVSFIFRKIKKILEIILKKSLFESKPKNWMSFWMMV